MPDPPARKNVPPGFDAGTLTVVALLTTPTGVVVAVTFVTAARTAGAAPDAC